jgi:phosphotransferase system HPr-like phosphotransfer protein
MLGFKVVSLKNWEEAIEKAQKKGERNQFSQVEKLKSEIEVLKLQLKAKSDSHLQILENKRKNDVVFNIALKNESELRTAIRELIEVYNGKAPAISITNEDLIKELKDLTSENFKTFTKQAQLLMDVAENKNIKSITAVEEYLATFESLQDEE